MTSVARWTVLFLMVFKQTRPISSKPLVIEEEEKILEKKEIERILEAIRIGDINDFSEKRVFDILKELNKAGYYHKRNDFKRLRSGQQGFMDEEECWRNYLTCEAAGINVKKLLNYLKSHGRIEIPQHGSTAYNQFITSFHESKERENKS